MNAQTNTQHTPGPWSVDHEDDAIVISQPGKDGSVITSLRHVAGEPEWEANARLIAAAPELLEALRDAESEIIRLHHVHRQDSGKIGEPDIEIAIRARAAIAKAIRV